MRVQFFGERGHKRVHLDEKNGPEKNFQAPPHATDALDKGPALSARVPQDTTPPHETIKRSNRPFYAPAAWRGRGFPKEGNTIVLHGLKQNEGHDQSKWEGEWVVN